MRPDGSLRTVVVLQDLYDTGANRVSLDRATRWQAAGDDVVLFVVMHEAGGEQPLVPEGVDVVRGTARPAALRRALPVGLWRLVLLSRRASVVVAGTEVGFGLLLAWCAARLARRPFAVTVQSHAGRAIQDGVESWLRAVTRSALTRADLAVCVAQGLVPTLVELGLPASRTAVVRNAVPARAVRAAAAQAPDVVPDLSRPVVVACGRLVHQKGFDLLLRAHARALHEGAPVHTLLVLGEGEDRAALAELAETLGVSETVHLAGFTANPHAVIARADLFVLSSRWEGFPLALVEALACGTPCVAFDCTAGPSEVLMDGARGRLVPPQDVAALAAAITEHLRDPAPLLDKVQQLGDGAPELFDPDAAAARHRAALLRPLPARRRLRTT